MCGRFTLRASPKDLADLFAVDVQLELLPRFNVAPTQEVLAIRAAAGSEQGGRTAREAVLLRWGLVPSWADDPTIGNSLINARAETLATKPAFRKAYAQRRCLIAADGFYEWEKASGGKQPYHITRSDGRPFAFAGLYERWRRGELAIESCTIITTEANELLQPLHNRMPVILAERDFATWLDPNQSEISRLNALLRPLPAAELKLTPVSQLVNRPGNEGPECIETISAPPAAKPPSARRQSPTLFDLHG